MEELAATISHTLGHLHAEMVAMVEMGLDNQPEFYRNQGALNALCQTLSDITGQTVAEVMDMAGFEVRP